MKNYIVTHFKTYTFLLIIFFSFRSFSQENIEIKKPSEGKSLVYFIRPTAVAFLVDFKLFHKDKFLGNLSSKRYIAYECEPGEHLFWATSENRDYVVANLEANKTYVVQVNPQMGAFVAGVNLIPCDPNNVSHKKMFHKAIKKGKEIVYDESVSSGVNQEDTIKKGLEKYDELTANQSSKIAYLKPEMNFLNANPVK